VYKRQKHVVNRTFNFRMMFQKIIFATVAINVVGGLLNNSFFRDIFLVRNKYFDKYETISKIVLWLNKWFHFFNVYIIYKYILNDFR